MSIFVSIFPPKGSARIHCFDWVEKPKIVMFLRIRRTLSKLLPMQRRLPLFVWTWVRWMFLLGFFLNLFSFFGGYEVGTRLRGCSPILWWEKYIYFIYFKVHSDIEQQCIMIYFRVKILSFPKRHVCFYMTHIYVCIYFDYDNIMRC